MPSAISPTQSMSPTKAPFVFPAEQPELVLNEPSDALSPVLPSLGDFMGSSRRSFMDEPNDTDLMKVPSNGSSVYSNLNEYRKSRVVTVGSDESALDDIVKFTNVQAERMLSPQGSIADFHADQRTGSSPSISRPEPVQRTSNNSDKSVYSAYSSNSSNLAQRNSPSQPPKAPLPALPLGKKASSIFTAEQRGSFASSQLASPNSSNNNNQNNAQTLRNVSPPQTTNVKSNSPFNQSVDLLSQYPGGDSQRHTYQPYQPSSGFSAQQERNSTFAASHSNTDLPSSLRPFSPPIDTMGGNASKMNGSATKLAKEPIPQPLHHAETIEVAGPPSAPLELKRNEAVPRKVSPTGAMGGFSGLRNKISTRPSEDQPLVPEIKEKEAERPKTGSRFGKLKSRMKSSNEDENSTSSIPEPKAAKDKEEGSSWSKLKSKVKKGRSGEDKVETDKDGKPMLTPISTTNLSDTTSAPKLGSPFKPSVSPGFETPAAPQYQAYRPSSAGTEPRDISHGAETSVSTIRPFTPGNGAPLVKTDSELGLTPTAVQLSQIHPLYRSDAAANSSETLTKLDSLRAPAPQFHPDAQALRQRAGSAPNRGPSSGPNSNNNSPMISRNNSGANSPSGYPFPLLPPSQGLQERRPQTGVVKGPKNDFPMMMPKELAPEMAAILQKSPFLNTPAIKRKALPSSTAGSDKAEDSKNSASGGSSGSNTLVAEDETIYPAPPITLPQMECFQAHRQMRTSRNDVYAVACSICNVEDRGKRWCCAWCSLRCCQDCIRKLRSEKGGLVGILNSLGKGDVVQFLYADKATKAAEAEKLINLSDISSFSFDKEKGITNGMPGALAATPQLA